MAKITRFIRNEMTNEDMNNMRLPKTTLVRLKSEKGAIGRASLNTINTINEYIKMKDEKQKHIQVNMQAQNDLNRTKKKQTIHHVGVDIGTRNILSASDPLMKKTFTTNNKRIKNIISNYRNRKTNKLSQKGLMNMQDEFNRTLETNISKIVNELIHYYGEGITFVIGDLSNQHPNIQDNLIYHKDSLLSIIFQKFVNTFKLYQMTYNFDIAFIGENATSIICPECNQSSRDNRTKSHNRFECVNCGFHHHTDDEVAGCNIVKRYLQQQSNLSKENN